MTVVNRLDRGRRLDLYEKAVAATVLLKDVLGPSAELATVEWSEATRTGPKGPRVVVRLDLSDPRSGSQHAEFAPEEFDDLLHLRYRLYDLWGDLLQQRSRKGLDRLESLLSGSSEE